MPRPPTARWDIFCRVVDNYGDAGVCWRLARILAREHGLAVTLWIDAPAALAHVDPGVDPSRDVQGLTGVTLRRWTEPFPGLSAGEVPDVVVEGFGCGLPDVVVAALAARPVPAAWFILEYLSAESWIDGAHARPSPHPALGLPRRFWFPGFTAASGGLLREAGLLEARRRFAADAGAVAALWARLGVRDRAPGELRVSMFRYPQAPLAALEAAWATGPARVTCIAPDPAGASPPHVRGALTVVRIPFLPPDDYDRLLWACDVNFVRGEDSFVRAQWAGKPLVWQIYAQAEAAHQRKLAAFLDRYCAGLGQDAAAAARGLFAAWNAAPGAPPIGPAWATYATVRPALAASATAWALHLARLPELAAGLVTAARGGV
jgi:uncharacterized repeat protein (TIGR03837 family)